MRLLKIITFKRVTPAVRKKYKLRLTARAIVFRNNKIAFINVKKHHYHKLPGGGVETGENLIKALRRECREEIGFNIRIGKPIGLIVEWRDNWQIKQNSYCYFAKVGSRSGVTKYTKDEKEMGFNLQWVTITKAIEIIKKDKPNHYLGRFVKVRDLAYLQAAQ